MNASLKNRTDRLTRTAYRHLLWEAYAPVLALGVLCALVFIIGSLSGLWQRIGDPWRLIALIAALIFLGKSVLRARARLRPTTSQARRRVEADNNLSHRPLDTLTDTPAFGAQQDPAWQSHMHHAQAQLENTSTSRLRPTLKPIDPYYLRFAVPFLVVCAFIIGIGDNYERLRASLSPTWQSGIGAASARYEAWIDPPEYTGRPPSYFKQSNTIEAPEGSEFVARISGVKTAPRLILREGNRTRRITAKRLGPQSFEARAIVTKPALAHYRIGNHTKEWVLNVDADEFPSIEFETPPDAGKRDRLIFTYNLKDDFGVESLSLALALQADPDTKDMIAISLPGISVRLAENEPAGIDLTKHKWADKKAVGYLIAVDGKGQISTSQVKDFIIPGHVFVEPLAKAVAEQRLLMLAGRESYTQIKTSRSITTIDDLNNRPMFAADAPERSIMRAPQPVQRAAKLIEIITDRPSGIFDDPAVYMGLRNVYRRIHLAQSQPSLSGIPQDLWTIALRAEFGVLGDALADMRAAERAFNNAMARRAPQREIDALFTRYNKAVDRYMEELMKKAIENAKKQDSGGGGDAADFQTDEIQELLDAIAEANRLGDTVAARKALAQLAQLLENMKIQINQGSGQGDGPNDGAMSEELAKALEELNDILGEQRQLRDETQSAGRENDAGNPGGDQKTPSQKGGKSADQLAQEQKELSDLLGALEDETKKGLGQEKNGDDGAGKEGGGSNTADIQNALKNAKKAMKDSENALANGEYYRAGRSQSDAIDALRKAGKGLFAEEAEKIKKAKGNKSGGSEGSDPFGRENDGNGVEDELDMPDIDDQKRARELLKKLRKRSGEQERDKIERDYLDRLLERF